MNSNCLANPDFEHLRLYINRIHLDFNNMGTVTKDDRNEIRIVELNGTKLVIKSFKKITIANKIIYSLFRKSKARRSYENAVRLLELEICSPTPVAYLDVYDKIYLKSSYFVSCFVEYETVESYIENHPNMHLLEDIGEFLFKLHEKQVFHYDLNISNILVNKDNEGEFNFCLVDMNRLKFKKPTKSRRV